MRFPWLWPAIIILSTIVAGLVSFMDMGVVVRPYVVMWFLFICPGMALVRFLRLRELVVELTLAVAVSLSVDAIIAALFMYSGKWSPPNIMAVLLGLSLLGAIAQLIVLPLFPHLFLSTVEDVETVKLATYTAEDIEEKSTVLMPVAQALPAEDIEERSTVLIPAVKARSAEDIEEKSTVLIPAVKARSAADIEEKSTVLMPATKAQGTEDVEEKATVEAPIAPQEEAWGIEEKPTTEMATAPSGIEEKPTVETQAAMEMREEQVVVETPVAVSEKVEEKLTVVMPAATAEEASDIEEKATVEIPAEAAEKAKDIGEKPTIATPVASAGSTRGTGTDGAKQKESDPSWYAPSGGLTPHPQTDGNKEESPVLPPDEHSPVSEGTPKPSGSPTPALRRGPRRLRPVRYEEN